MKRFIVLICVFGVVAGGALGFASSASAVIDCQQWVKCIGTDGNNTMEGTSAPDWIVGLGGADDIYGHDSGDTLEGNAGGDALYGGAGVNHMFGGGGDDWLFSNGSCSPQEFDGGNGWDSATYMAGAGNTFDSVEHRVQMGSC